MCATTHVLFQKHCHVYASFVFAANERKIQVISLIESQGNMYSATEKNE